MDSMDRQIQQSTTTSDQTSCLLLGLPPELRNHIYEYLLLGGEDEAPVHVTDCLSEERGLPPIILQAGSEELWQPPAILQTCQQIRDEATPVYYTTNTFDVFVDSRDLERTICHWLTALGSHIRDKIRTIHLGLMYDRLEVAETGLEMFDDMLNKADCRVRQGTISVEVFKRYATSDDVVTSPYDLLQIWPGANGDYVLVDPPEVLVTNHWRPPALFSMSKQVRREALKIYFAENIFRIDMYALIPGPLRETGYMSALARWFRPMSTPGRDALKTVHIDDIFYRTQDEAKEALMYYTKGLAEAGCGVADGVLFVEGRISDIEVSVDKPFWTNNPTSDFARVKQQHIQAMKKS
ncbi:hypothetical protein LTR35_009679 [Friedmanniomyces endolithicus]|uniref:Uncharacterized protein n=1 Tax=Friedmanniomyces endolithicus TaxID=329885 RepID=A0AAN6FPD9_9PEZI|nr:hypothetical protein LTR35_009679 [Friedmanniomyces endolithicus]KAK0321297.1 hypothetical protein LTR82_007749 [Friedmanniomyces endolithicus]KAK1018807.1 hypothetical protein LTR54_000618 [Friedmanniomyces endolithicus]